MLSEDIQETIAAGRLHNESGKEPAIHQ